MTKQWASPQQSTSDLISSYKAAITRDKCINWKRGDLALEYTHRMQAEKDRAVRHKMLDEFLAKTGETKKSFDNLRWIAQEYPTQDDRDIPVSWTHFRAVAGLEPGFRRSLLQSASAEAWSTRQLEQIVQLAKEL